MLPTHNELPCLGKTGLLVTHEIDEAIFMASRVVIVTAWRRSRERQQSASQQAKKMPPHFWPCSIRTIRITLAERPDGTSAPALVVPTGKPRAALDVRADRTSDLVLGDGPLFSVRARADGTPTVVLTDGQVQLGLGVSNGKAAIGVRDRDGNVVWKAP